MDNYDFSVRTWDYEIREKISSVARKHEGAVTVEVKDSGFGFYTGGVLLLVTIIAVSASVLTIANIIYEWLKDHNKKKTTISLEIGGTGLSLNGLEPDAIADVLMAYEKRKLAQDDRKKLALYMGERLLSASPDDQMDLLQNISSLQVEIPFERILPLAELDDAHLQVQVVHTLRILGYPEIIDLLSRFLHSHEWYVRMELTSELVHVDDSHRWQLLEPLVRDESSFVRDRAALVLGEIGGPKSIHLCKVLLRDESWSVQVRAVESLKRAVEAPCFSDNDTRRELLGLFDTFRKRSQQLRECRQRIDKILEDTLHQQDQ